MRPIELFKDRVTAASTSVFKHAPYPLARTLDHPGDLGVCGPGSVSWEVIADPAAFVGGIRALILQAAHPEVAAGLAAHSRYRVDPLGRLSRTTNYVTATTFGATPEVLAAVGVVTAMHRRVRGRSHRGVEYSADAPGLAAWVHNVLTDSFLTAQEAYGTRRLTPEEADHFVSEQAVIGELLHAEPVPRTARALADWMDGHREIGDSPGRAEAVAFLRHPPLPIGIRIGYWVLFRGAAATIPRDLRRLLGVRRIPGAITATRILIRFLRWALGPSPSWKLALLRVGAEIPKGLFRQPVPIEALDDWGRERTADSEQPTADPSG